MATAPDPSRVYPLLIDGTLATNGTTREIRSPFSGKPVGLTAVATATDVAHAIDAAVRSAPEARSLPSHRRADVLERMYTLACGRRDELAVLLAHEAGKPVKAARLEVDRTLFVFRTAAEDAKRIGGEVMPLDRMPHGTGRWGITRRFPLAPIAGIVPFNFPLLLAAHKLAPAIACGATMVLKTPPQDPLSTLLMAEITRDSGYPDGGINVIQCDVEDAAPLLDDPRVQMVTFTGSARAGWAIRERAARKKVALELGGNAGIVIEPDADLDHAATRTVLGGFSYAGQSCISVQRILVNETVYEPFTEALVSRVRTLVTGDPLDEQTDVGPLIDQQAAERAEAWVAEAVAAGATLATGGTREGAVLQPTVLLDTTSEMKVNCDEVFAPVVTVRPYTEFADALTMVNDSPYGLQAGVFTHDIRKIWQAFEQIDVGGLVINDISGFRVDHMPYGGIKQSGLGREGVRYAIEEMTELKLLML